MDTAWWIRELELWMAKSGHKKKDVARRSKHHTVHVLEIFNQLEPNPSLGMYLDLVDLVGARFASVRNNTPAAVIERLKEIKDREKITTVALAKRSKISRPQLSTLLNHASPNPSLATFDRLVTALDVRSEFGLVHYLAHSVRLALAAGGLSKAEAQEAVTRTIETTTAPRLHVVPDQPDTSLYEDELEDARVEQEQAASAELHAANAELHSANEKLANLCDKFALLQTAHLTLEKELADDKAEMRRLEQRGNRAWMVAIGASVVASFGLTAAAHQYATASRLRDRSGSQR